MLCGTVLWFYVQLYIPLLHVRVTQINAKSSSHHFSVLNIILGILDIIVHLASNSFNDLLAGTELVIKWGGLSVLAGSSR